jgi:DNA-binding transcriptional LysR family regulator
MITFEQLEALRVIVRTGTFSRAADQLYLTQPALSQRIKHLEQTLGVELFDRSRRGRRILLTPAGEMVLRFAEQFSEEFARLLANIDEVVGESKRETLSIAVGPNATRYLLPEALEQFRVQRPHVRLNIVQTLAIGDMINQAVLNGTAELGITLAPKSDSRLDSVFFYLYHVLLVTTPTHPAARLSPLDDERLLRLEFALFPAHASESRQVLEKQAHAFGHRLDVVFESNDFNALKDAAQRGVAIALLPEHVVRDELASGELVSLPGLGFPRDVDIHLVFDPSRRLSPAAQAFVDMAQEQRAVAVPGAAG